MILIVLSLLYYDSDSTSNLPQHSNDNKNDSNKEKNDVLLARLIIINRIVIVRRTVVQFVDS